MENNAVENMNDNKEEKKKNVKNGGGNIFLRIRWLLFGVILGFVCCVMFYFGVKTEVNNNQKKPEVNVDYLTGTIREMSDLISAELDFSGVLEYETENSAKELLNIAIDGMKQEKLEIPKTTTFDKMKVAKNKSVFLVKTTGKS